MRRGIRLLGQAFAAATAMARPLHAQDAPPDSQIIVTATRQPAPVARQPYSAEILESESLEASESIADAITRLPDVHVQMPGGRTGFASIFLRGADPNFTAVLLEGVPLDSPTNSRGGAVNLAETPSNGIDRLELLSGPATTLYGSGALAGAVNLLLAPPRTSHQMTAKASVGSEAEYAISGQWQGPLAQGFGGSLTAVIDDAGSGAPLSRFRSRSVNVRLGPFNRADGGLLVHWAGTRSRGFPDSSGGFLFADIRDVEQRKSEEVILAVDQPVLRSKRTTFAIAASYFSREDRTISPGVAPSLQISSGVPAGLDHVHYRRTVIRPHLTIDLGEGHATLGVQAQWEHATSAGELDLGFPVPTSYDKGRSTYSAFIEFAEALGDLETNTGFRIDDIQEIGLRWTGRVGLRYFFAPNFSARAALGTAFKAPSFYALSNPFIGNPALEPEEATSAEMGIDWHLGTSNRASVVYFNARYTNLIDFLPTNPPRLENRARVIAQGVSATLSRQLSRNLLGSLAAQYVKTEDAASGMRLLNRPRWRVGAEIQWKATDGLTIEARYAFSDKRDDFAIPTGILTLDVAHRSAVSAVWTINSQLNFRLDAENLLGDKSPDAIGFPALPRRVRVSLTHRFD